MRLDAAAKRLLDIALSLVVITLTAPLWIVVAVAIRLTSPGSTLYGGRRIGARGDEFRMYKFRTMRADADRVGPAVTGADDPRITRVGRVLRSSKMDELPQLLNVLRGDMSLVGPRPEAPEYVRLYDDRQRQVLSVRPGITGPTQLLYRHEERVLQNGDVERQYVTELLPQKLELDLEYIRDRSLIGDLRLLVATVACLFQRFQPTTPQSASDRLRISHVITLGGPMAGAQFNTYYSVRYQRRIDEVEVIMGTDGPFREICEAEGIPSRVIVFKNVLLDPIGDVIALVRMIRHFRRTRPDVVHTHSSKAGLLGRLAGRLAGVPVVVHTVHGLAYRENQHALVRWGLISVERLAALCTDHFISVADTLSDDLARRRICGRHEVTTVVSGIPFESFPRDAARTRRHVRTMLGIPEHAPVAIAVGTLQQNKAHEILIDAAHHLVSSYPELRVLIVGPTVALEAEVRDNLQRQIDDLGLVDRVTLCGMRDDVPDVLAAADVFVQTSWHEGLSRSLVEAMFSGLPVVATDVGATREVVHEGETGFLIRPGDSQQLAASLSTFLSNPQLRRSIGDRARQLIGETRSTEAMGSALNRIYRRLAAQKGVFKTPEGAPAITADVT